MNDYIKPIQIGNVRLDNNVFLAPLAGVADSPFRAICKSFGAGLVYSEMISSKGVHYKSRGSVELSEHRPLEEPFAVQIFGCEPEILAESAKVFESRGAKIIDINMGCPVPKVTGNLEGSYLLNNPDLIYDIVKAVSDSVSVPVTVKMRAGYTVGNEVAPLCAKKAEAGGASAVAIHGRFRDEYYSGKCDHGVIKRVRDAVSIPVIASGDITSPETANQMFIDTGVDAIMIGRGALGRPWIFSEILLGETINKSIPEIKEIILNQLDMAIIDKGEHIAVTEMRKHIAWYLKGTRNAAAIKNAIFSSNTKSELISVLDYWG